MHIMCFHNSVLSLAGPVINPGVLPDNTTAGAKGVAVGTGQTRVISGGTDVVILCELKSTTMPASTISWSRFTSTGIREEIIDDDSKFDIVSTGRQSELTIAVFDTTDVATYRCTAQNTVGSDTADVRLSLCPADALPCTQPISPDYFNIALEVTEGLSDTCPYCATWSTGEFGPVSRSGCI